MRTRVLGAIHTASKALTPIGEVLASSDAGEVALGSVYVSVCVLRQKNLNFMDGYLEKMLCKTNQEAEMRGIALAAEHGRKIDPFLYLITDMRNGPHWIASTKACPTEYRSEQRKIRALLSSYDDWTVQFMRGKDFNQAANALADVGKVAESTGAFDHNSTLSLKHLQEWNKERTKFFMKKLLAFQKGSKEEEEAAEIPYPEKYWVEKNFTWKKEEDELSFLIKKLISHKRTQAAIATFDGVVQREMDDLKFRGQLEQEKANPKLPKDKVCKKKKGKN